MNPGVLLRDLFDSCPIRPSNAERELRQVEMSDWSADPIKCRPFSRLIRPVPKARYCKPRPCHRFRPPNAS